VNTPETLSDIQQSLGLFKPELALAFTLLSLIVIGFFPSLKNSFAAAWMFSIGVALSFYFIINDFGVNNHLFSASLSKQTFSDSLKLLFDLGGLLTCLLTIFSGHREKTSQYFSLIITVILGAHLLVMSSDLLLVLLSIELISIPSYILTGFSFSKKSAESTLKYFIYGAVASAVMIYGFSFIYGLCGTINIDSDIFLTSMSESKSLLFFIAIVLVLVGILFKVAAVPMHLWAPDVYQAAPTPVVAFFSVVPKLAGVGILTKLTMVLSPSAHDWQFIIAAIAILTITIGNFSALAQTNAKRMMGYSSIAQSGFILCAVCLFNTQGLKFIVFYSSVYLIANFLVFHFITVFEKKGIENVEQYAGLGKNFFWPSLFMLVGLISLTGLPPTAGFISKLFVFTGIWESFAITGDKPVMLALLVIGLLNTVVSLFFYLKIPFYAFMKQGETAEKQNFLTVKNLFGLLLVVLLLALFFAPTLLMSWINKANFVF
jgi:NADH-quinone oxidoreductase subunit N